MSSEDGGRTFHHKKIRGISCTEEYCGGFGAGHTCPIYASMSEKLESDGYKWDPEGHRGSSIEDEFGLTDTAIHWYKKADGSSESLVVLECERKIPLNRKTDVKLSKNTECRFGLLFNNIPDEYKEKIDDFLMEQFSFLDEVLGGKDISLAIKARTAYETGLY